MMTIRMKSEGHADDTSGARPFPFPRFRVYSARISSSSLSLSLSPHLCFPFSLADPFWRICQIRSWSESWQKEWSLKSLTLRLSALFIHSLTLASSPLLSVVLMCLHGVRIIRPTDARTTALPDHQIVARRSSSSSSFNIRIDFHGKILLFVPVDLKGANRQMIRMCVPVPLWLDEHADEHDFYDATQNELFFFLFFPSIPSAHLFSPTFSFTSAGDPVARCCFSFQLVNISFHTQTQAAASGQSYV